MNTATIPDDETIRRQLLANFDSGFTSLVKTYQQGIYSGARRLTAREEDAQEVSQDTFERAYRALSAYDRERIEVLKLRPWLWTIALNLCRNRARRSNTESRLVDEAVTYEDREPLDDQAWSDRLGRLSRPQRTAVVLRHVLDLSVADIAEATGRPEGTIKADISRGLARLRSTLTLEQQT